MEIVVIDDGSSDNTAAEVENVAAADGRVRLIRQDNRGKARALQRGIAAAKHELIIFIDADVQPLDLGFDTVRAVRRLS